MRKLALLALLLVASLFAAPVFAQSCPTQPSAVQIFCGGYDWTQAQSCYSTTAGVSTTSPGCWYYDPAWSFSAAWTMSASTTITASSTYMYTSSWSAASFIEFSNGNNSAYNWIELVAVVTHNGFDSRYSLFYWDGTMGSLNGCAQQYGTFSAVSGDTISVRLYALNADGATIKASVPRIFNDECP